MFIQYVCSFLTHTHTHHRLFILLMNAVKLDAEAGEVDHSSLLTVVLHLSQLLESFILSSFPHFTTDTGTYIQYVQQTFFFHLQNIVPEGRKLFHKLNYNYCLAQFW